jgi:hypothetical protein
MTTYPVFATATNAQLIIIDGVIVGSANETLSGTIEVTGLDAEGHGIITGVHLQESSYPGITFDTLGTVIGGTGSGTSMWTLDSAANPPSSGIEIRFGTHESLPHVGADIFGFSACCNPMILVWPANWLAAPSLGTIANLPLPVSTSAVPAPELGTGWPALILAVGLLGWWRNKRRAQAAA